MANEEMRDGHGLGPSLSTYLDLLRFGAAMVVFFSHAALPRLTGELLPLNVFVELADGAVMAFFVLSGFVIAYAAQTRDKNLADYTGARLARLYSVALPALALTVVADAIGRRLDPSIYAHLADQDVGPFLQIAACTLFLNEIWYLSIRPLSDGPYWSIGYEFWYYVLFGIGFYLRGPRRWVFAAVVTVFIGPKILALFPIWLLGLGAYRIRNRIGEAVGWTLFLGSLGTVVALRAERVAWLLYWWKDALIVRHLGTGYSRHLPSKYTVGLLVAANILGFAGIQHRIPLAAIQRPVRALAGMTFSLYLFHYPLLHLFGSALPGDVDSPLRATVLISLSLLSVALLAAVTERQKKLARRIVDAVGGALTHRVPAVSLK